MENSTLCNPNFLNFLRWEFILTRYSKNIRKNVAYLIIDGK